MYKLLCEMIVNHQTEFIHKHGVLKIVDTSACETLMHECTAVELLLKTSNYFLKKSTKPTSDFKSIFIIAF